MNEFQPHKELKQNYMYRFVGWLDSAVPIEDAFL
jgi:hypothetical protein